MKGKSTCMKMLLGAGCLLIFAGSGWGTEPDAYGIVRQSRDLMDQARDSVAEMTMTLVNPKGGQRLRKLITYARRDEDGRDKSLLVFKSPPDVKGTSFLVWSDPEGDADQQWLYLPALGRVRQIATASKSESFMGTEFSYDDMGTHDIDDSTGCYVIEARPKEPHSYGKMILWIRSDNYIPVRTDFYDLKGRLLKQGRFSRIQTIKGIATPTLIEMENLTNGRKTILELSNIRYDTGLSEDLFTQRQMMRGR